MNTRIFYIVVGLILLALLLTGALYYRLSNQNRSATKTEETIQENQVTLESSSQTADLDLPPLPQSPTPAETPVTPKYEADQTKDSKQQTVPETTVPTTNVADTSQTTTSISSNTQTSTPTSAESTQSPNQTASSNDTTQSDHSKSTTDQTQAEQAQTPETTANPTSANPSCTSNKSPTFTHHMTDLNLVAKIVSPPTKAGNDLKPHGYLDTQLKVAPVYTPTAVTLDSGAYYQEGNPGGEYLLIFRVSCEITFRFDHITKPVQSIIDAFPTLQSDTRTKEPSTVLSFLAGEQIGTTTGTLYGIWDFGVYNSSTTNRYANDPEWNWSDNAKTAVCPWGYYSTSMYNQYKTLFGSLSGNPADGEPFCN